MSHVSNLESSNQEVNRVQTVLFLFLKKKFKKSFIAYSGH